MGIHTQHQMQLTSLFCKWPNYSEEQYNQKFRQEIEKKIIMFHLDHKEGLTDEELLRLFGNPDTNLIRPRRCDLSRERKKRPSFLYDSGKTRLNKFGRLCIVWKLNQENLAAYMGN